MPTHHTYTQCPGPDVCDVYAEMKTNQQLWYASHITNLIVITAVTLALLSNIW